MSDKLKNLLEFIIGEEDDDPTEEDIIEVNTTLPFEDENYDEANKE